MRELSLNILDVAQNSISAGSKHICIDVTRSEQDDRLVIRMTDDGCGMTPEQIEQVTDPFYTTRTTRKVGLGVPLFKMAAEMTGGTFSITAETGKGTRAEAFFVPSHMDMTPLGDINATIGILIRCNPDLDFLFHHKTDAGEFTLNTEELRGVLGGDVSLDHPDIMEWIEGFLQEQTDIISGGSMI